MRCAMLAAMLVALIPGCSSVQSNRIADDNTPPPPEFEDKWDVTPAAVPFLRIGRGTINLVLSPLDIPATVVRVSREEDNVGYALLAGFFEGIGNGLTRALMGITEILTFPLIFHPEPFYERDLGDRAFPQKPPPIP